MIDSLVSFILGLAGGNAALAIVLFTLAVRVALLPLSIKQARGARVREKLAPKLKALQERHAKNPERLGKELNALYAAEGTSPFAGILPSLAQLPFVWLIYRVATHPTALAGHTLFGAPLGQQVAGVVANFGLISMPVLVFAIVLVLLVLVAWHSSRKIEGPAWMKLMPFGSVVAALFMPLATGLYLVVSTAWTAGERQVLASRPL
ncbi:YidC/Oxa1 family membrane protein insertase [Nonomuraea sp. NBC_01738]|uniref:YidC/Oxa1 family membrane protein insertase n=1 Tax=Nonomuraea sp. NBC_01738 TaxID=2976003 RepID=UPI002E13798F|nr:YidC/Oxa1 family membrane protein insertase [Nonomuraea sp. NBC_01738]